jgi:hypothetical protein
MVIVALVAGYLLVRRAADFERARPAPPRRAERPWHAAPS